MDVLYTLDHLLSSETKLLRESVRKFVEQQINPDINKWFEQAALPRDIIKKLADLGAFRIKLPTKYGGIESDAVSYGILCQELERGDSGLRSLVSVQNALVIFPILQFGTDQQKNTYLSKLGTGELLGCFGLTEPDAGSDPGSMHTVAEKVGDNWVINGSKMWVTNATWADVAIVWAKVKKTGVIHGFIVEKNTPGFNTVEIKHKMSMRASNTGELIFNNCKISSEAMLPGTEKGLSSALKCLTQARYGIAWGAIGAAMACYEQVLAYCKTRKVFDHPIASKQLVQSKLVAMYSEIVKAQTLNYQIAKLKDQDQASYMMISLAKMNACREALKIARMARELLGANGISLDYQIIRHMLNLETVITYEGTDHIHQLIIGRELTGETAL